MNLKQRIFWTVAGLASFAMAENPIIQTYYSPDPAPVVFGDTVCVYTGNDEGGSFFTMHGWRVSCSTDMVNWTDRGTLILQNSDFPNAKKNGDWASQCIYRNGKYYYYVTVESTLGGRAINVAVADKPEGPFKNATGNNHLAGPNWDYIDPTVFVDDDGQAYIYFGNPTLYWAKLNDDMISFNGEIHATDMNSGFAPANEESKYTEGPWIHKRGNKYYMIYASHGVPEKISYSTSNSPTGPWTWGGVIMEQGNNTAFTNHSGIIEFKGRSFFFYHNQKNVNGGGYSRSTAVEEFTWNADGSIPTITSTNDGVKTPIHNLNPYSRVEAETKSWVGGMTVTTTDANGDPATIINHVNAENGTVYLTNMTEGFYTKVRSVDMSDGADKIILATRGNGGELELHTESETGPTLAKIRIPASSAWQENAFEVSGADGVQNLFFVVKQGGFDFDYWYLESNAVKIPQQPYQGTAVEIPGVIQAENYDEPGTGQSGKSFEDSDSENQGKVYRNDAVDIVGFNCSDVDNSADCEGYAVGYTQVGEWMEYTIQVTAKGSYMVKANVATPFETSGIQLYVDDEPVTEEIVLPKIDTAWNVYKEVELGEVSLENGEHILKVLVTGSYVNIDWLSIANPGDLDGLRSIKKDSRKDFEKSNLRTNGKSLFVYRKGKKFDLLGNQIQ
ncbi:MAG: family 43 glycosylhydrolase [Fibrobacter sp.]|nr:family 43 glycosylhydrolase [Fibrobacter sp.]